VRQGVKGTRHLCRRRYPLRPDDGDEITGANTGAIGTRARLYTDHFDAGARHVAKPETQRQILRRLDHGSGDDRHFADLTFASHAKLYFFAARDVARTRTPVGRIADRLSVHGFDQIGRCHLLCGGTIGVDPGNRQSKRRLLQGDTEMPGCMGRVFRKSSGAVEHQLPRDERETSCVFHRNPCKQTFGREDERAWRERHSRGETPDGSVPYTALDRRQ
jgi:hypothetical protein